MFQKEKSLLMRECLVGEDDCVFEYIIPEITKYGIMVRMVRESLSGNICNMQTFDGNRGPLTDTVGFLLEPFKGKGYHVYQDNYYNSVQLTEELMEKSISVCGTIRPNRGLPRDMIQEAQQLKKGEVTFHRKQDVLLLLSF
jgi:hypothetical protein